VTCLAAAVQRCLIVKTAWHETLLLYIVAFLLIKPGLLTDIAGFGLFSAVFALQWRARRRRWTAAEGQPVVQPLR
jgi:TRAP-type uncharacterized transport system fused permease subunit